MSRARGVFPIFLATAFGIVNGVAIFGPSFKEQQQEKENQERKLQEIIRLTEGEGVKLEVAEAAASRAIATENALKEQPVSASWWPQLNMWSNRATSPNPVDAPITETKEKSRDGS